MACPAASPLSEVLTAAWRNFWKSLSLSPICTGESEEE